MISRHWKGFAKFEAAENYTHRLRMETFPQLSTIRGFVEATLLKRTVDQGIEFLIVTVWDSMAAIKQFASESVNIAVVPPAGQAMRVEFDRDAVHYTVEPRDPARNIS